MGICAHVLSKMSRKVDTRLQRVVTLAVWWGGVGEREREVAFLFYVALYRWTFESGPVLLWQ